MKPIITLKEQEDVLIVLSKNLLLSRVSAVQCKDNGPIANGRIADRGHANDKQVECTINYNKKHETCEKNASNSQALPIKKIKKMHTVFT